MLEIGTLGWAVMIGLIVVLLAADLAGDVATAHGWIPGGGCLGPRP